MRLPARFRRAACAAAAVLSLSACDAFGSDEGHFAEARYYAYDFFPTVEECLAHQPPGWFVNCSQTALFCPGGHAVVMVTDILNQGSYTLSGRRIRVRMENGGELVERFEFRLFAGGDSLTDPGGLVWRRQPPALEAQAAADQCG